MKSASVGIVAHPAEPALKRDNPMPFGKKSSVTIVNEAGETCKESLIINRDDLPPPRLCSLASLLANKINSPSHLTA